jgi:predicted RecA/RadA family phage recombinase
MKNRIQKGECLDLAAPRTLTSGQGALIGSIFGVATVDVASTVTAAFETRGVYDLTKATGSVTQGAKVYWDDTAHNVTTTATANTLIGVATQAAASGDATVRVKLGYVA